MKNVEMSGSLRERRSEEMTQSNTSFPRDSEVPLESQRVITIKISKNKEICGEGKNGVEKEVGFAIRRKKANKESINLKVRKRRRVMKMMTPLLAYGSSGERMPDRERVRLDRRAEYPEIWKEEDELRLESLI